jgi:hypothetical protein
VVFQDDAFKLLPQNFSNLLKSFLICATTLSPHDVVLALAFNHDTDRLPVTLQNLDQYMYGPVQVKTLKILIVLARMTASDSRASLRARQHVAFNHDTDWLPVTLQNLDQNVTDTIRHRIICMAQYRLKL